MPYVKLTTPTVFVAILHQKIFVSCLRKYKSKKNLEKKKKEKRSENKYLKPYCVSE